MLPAIDLVRKAAISRMVYTPRLQVLDLFAGLEGWSAPFRDRGHDVISLDLDPDFQCDITADILEWDSGTLGSWRPDIILASPPCEGFSVMNIGRNWTKPTDNPPNQPKTEQAWMAARLVKRTLMVIQELQPSWWVIENPRAKLRRMDFMQPFHRETVWYCHYGLPFAKPTDLWGGFPESWQPRPPCHNGCDDHNAAPRGSKTGIQGGSLVDAMRRGSLHQSKAAAREHYGTSSPKLLAALRAEIPYQLAQSICWAAETDMARRLND